METVIQNARLRSWDYSYVGILFLIINSKSWRVVVGLKIFRVVRAFSPSPQIGRPNSKMAETRRPRVVSRHAIFDGDTRIRWRNRRNSSMRSSIPSTNNKYSICITWANKSNHCYLQKIRSVYVSFAVYWNSCNAINNLINCRFDIITVKLFGTAFVVGTRSLI